MVTVRVTVMASPTLSAVDVDVMVTVNATQLNGNSVGCWMLIWVGVADVLGVVDTGALVVVPGDTCGASLGARVQAWGITSIAVRAHKENSVMAFMGIYLYHDRVTILFGNILPYLGRLQASEILATIFRDHSNLGFIKE